MGIIGVVAALTLPNLNSSTGEKEKVAKVKKFYSEFSDAFGRAEAVYGPVDEWFANDTTDADKRKRFADRLTEFMKLSKSCQTGTGCFTSGNTKRFRPEVPGGTYNYDGVTSYYKYVLADGMSLGFMDGSGASDILGAVVIDIDGPNHGGYTLGKDVFIMSITKDGTLKSWSDPSYSFDDLRDDCFENGEQCTGWIMATGNMDYLKADSHGKCPDGKTILDYTTNTTCK